MNPKKTIGFYCSSTSFGGLQLHMLRLASWMQERGWPVILYVLEDSKMGVDGKAMSLVIRPIKRNKRALDVTGASRIGKAFEKDNIDIVIIRDPRDISVVGLAKSFNKNFKIIYQQGMQLGGSKRDLVHTTRYNRIDAWLVSLDSLAKQLQVKAKYPQECVHVIPLGLELEQFDDPSLSKTEGRGQFDIPEDALILGNIGRFGVMKQQDLLVRGLHKLRSEGKDVHLLLVGESTQGEGDAFMASLKVLIQELDLDNYVHIRPYMTEVVHFYRSIDIFVLSSKNETYGMVTIEAMAAGLPILGTNSGGTKEILKGQFGLLFDPDSYEDFAEKAASLIDDEDKMQELGSLAQKEARGNYSHEKECQRIEELINTL